MCILLLRVMFVCICRELAKDFVVAGTASESLYGACEAMFKPDMVCFSIQLALPFPMHSQDLLFHLAVFFFFKYEIFSFWFFRYSGKSYMSPMYN